jgi:hypothetical protein
MKFKLFNLLALYLATLGGLAASQPAFGHSVERQLNGEQRQPLICVKDGQHLLCDIDKSGASDSHSAHQRAVKEVKAAVDIKSSTVNFAPQILSPAQQKSIADILLWFGYLLPFGTCLGILLYDKYCAYRSARLNQQIEMLESLWKQTSQH